MRKRIDDGGFETPYPLRKQVAEPVFGQIKQARGFRQFLLRGIEKVRAEWAMICTTHNLLKLFALAKAARGGYRGESLSMMVRFTHTNPEGASTRKILGNQHRAARFGGLGARGTSHQGSDL